MGASLLALAKSIYYRFIELTLSRQFSVPISRALLYRGSVPVSQRCTKKHDFRKDASLILASPRESNAAKGL